MIYVIAIVVVLCILFPQHAFNMIAVVALVAVIRRSSASYPIKSSDSWAQKLKRLFYNDHQLWSHEKVDKFFSMLDAKTEFHDNLYRLFNSGVREYLTNSSPSDQAVTDTMNYFEAAVVNSAYAPMFWRELDLRFANDDFESFKNHRNIAMQLFDIAYQNLELDHYDETLLDTEIRVYNSLLQLAQKAKTYEQEQSYLKNAENLKRDFEESRQRYKNIPDIPPIPASRW